MMRVRLGESSSGVHFDSCPIRRTQSGGPLTLISMCIAIVALMTQSFAAETDAAHKKPKPTPCLPVIAKCGCTIATSGFYQLGQKLTYSGTLNSDNSCVAISAPRVTLYLDGFDIADEQPSIGIGIHIDASASNSFIEGSGFVPPPHGTTGDSVVSGWDIGIEDDASGAIITGLAADSNNTAGIYIERAEGVSLTAFGAHSNSGYGVWLNGVAFTQVTNAVEPPSVGSAFQSTGIDNNGLEGILVTSATKPVQQTHDVRIYDNVIDTNASGGIVIQTNIVRVIVTANEASNNVGVDLSDSNNNCGSDLWFGNSFGEGSPSTCIH